MTGWLITCLVCLTSGLIKEKHHGPHSPKTHWSATLKHLMGEIHHRELLSPNQTHVERPNNTRPLVITDCLQTQWEDTLKEECVKRMVVDSRCRTREGRGREGETVGLAVLGHTNRGCVKPDHAASNPSSKSWLLIDKTHSRNPPTILYHLYLSYRI